MAILGLLVDQDLHGYELKRRLTRMLGTFSTVSFGSLYPALARLERGDAVRAVAQQEATSPIPMTGSLGGERAAWRARRPGSQTRRGRKVYHLTEAGRRRFDELLGGGAGDGDDVRAFTLRLAFARHLAPEARLRLLERRRGELLQRLSSARRRADVEAESLDRYARCVMDHSAEITEHDLSWVNRLIDDERHFDVEERGQR